MHLIFTVRELIIHKQGGLVSDYTVQAKVRTLKTFTSWPVREGCTSENVLANVKLTKVAEKAN